MNLDPTLVEHVCVACYEWRPCHELVIEVDRDKHMADYFPVCPACVPEQLEYVNHLRALTGLEPIPLWAVDSRP